MGLHIYLTESDRQRMNSVDDVELNEVYNEALKFDPSLLILELKDEKVKGFWFFKKVVTTVTYSLYSEGFNSENKRMYTAEYMGYASGVKEVTYAYLKGVCDLGKITQLKNNGEGC